VHHNWRGTGSWRSLCRQAIVDMSPPLPCRTEQSLPHCGAKRRELQGSRPGPRLPGKRKLRRRVQWLNSDPAAQTLGIIAGCQTKVASRKGNATDRQRTGHACFQLDRASERRMRNIRRISAAVADS
jgi:hypothetical protein